MTTPIPAPPTTAATSAARDSAGAAPSRTARPGPHGARWWREVGWRHVVALVAVAFAVFPVLFILSAAFNPLGTVASTGLVPRQFTLSNFTRLLSGERGPFVRWYANTVVLCLVVSSAQVFASALAAYAFSRFRFRGRRGGLLSLLLIQMFPQFLAVIAIFSMFSGVGEVVPAAGLNTLVGYGLVLMGGALLHVWLIKGFFDTVPRELDEAATIDGASHAQVFFRIVLPLIAPVLATTALLSFVGVINEFLIAGIFLTDDESKTLAVGLYGIIDSDRSNNLGLFAAGAVLFSVPVVLLFQFLQRFITGGLTAGSVKG
ncbi:sugar ABC transporter permease [Kineococcus sp. G2]|uniref:sugar ABC transporter permease n=1 Tax=Kineococcus sp. G2 TaxID=3127484 RepID=UPI00301BD4E5